MARPDDVPKLMGVHMPPGTPGSPDATPLATCEMQPSTTAGPPAAHLLGMVVVTLLKVQPRLQSQRIRGVRSDLSRLLRPP